MSDESHAKLFHRMILDKPCVYMLCKIPSRTPEAPPRLTWVDVVLNVGAVYNHTCEKKAHKPLAHLAHLVVEMLEEEGSSPRTSRSSVESGRSNRGSFSSDAERENRPDSFLSITMRALECGLVGENVCGLNGIAKRSSVNARCVVWSFHFGV